MKIIFITNDKIGKKIDTPLSIRNLSKSVLFKALNSISVYTENQIVNDADIQKFLKRERVTKIPKALFLNLQTAIAEKGNARLTSSELITLCIDAGNNVKRFFWINQIIKQISDSNKSIVVITDIVRIIDYKKIEKFASQNNYKIIYIDSTTPSGLEEFLDIKVEDV